MPVPCPQRSCKRSCLPCTRTICVLFSLKREGSAVCVTLHCLYAFAGDSTSRDRISRDCISPASPQAKPGTMQPSRPSSLSPHLLNRRGAQNAADRPLRSVRPAPRPAACHRCGADASRPHLRAAAASPSLRRRAAAASPSPHRRAAPSSPRRHAAAASPSPRRAAAASPSPCLRAPAAAAPPPALAFALLQRCLSSAAALPPR